MSPPGGAPDVDVWPDNPDWRTAIEYYLRLINEEMEEGA